MNPLVSRQEKLTLFKQILFLTVFFLLVEISFLSLCGDAFLGDFHYIAAHMVIPITMLPGIIYFILAQLFCHVLFAIFVWLLSCALSHLFGLSWPATQKLALTLWLIALITICTGNQYYFPNSQFCSFTTTIFSTIAAKNTFIVCNIILAITAFLSVIDCIFIFKRWAFVGLSIIGLLAIANFAHPARKVIGQSTVTPSQPNIIIIGVDSVRPDFVGFFNKDKNASPHLDHFLQQATVFNQAYTTIARTFPSWTSVLTGKYPKKNGARFDLANQSHIQFNQTLPAILKQHGYTTLYGTDETRFSNIGTAFGFDKIVTPPMGVNDFLLGTLNDFPLSNLLINTCLGKWLFPHSYANRSALATYEPHTFINLLTPAIQQLPHKPAFIAVHFCLPHYPYYWAKLPVAHNTLTVGAYQAAIRAADQQFEDFLSLLKRQGLLEHSIVIVLSDHGESFDLPGDRITEAKNFIPGKNNLKKIIPHFYPPSDDGSINGTDVINEAAGHGTDVLSLNQYHILLAIKMQGISAKNQAQLIQQRVNVLDIKPTLLSLVGITDKPGDGIVLFNRQKQFVAPPEKNFFIETDFTPIAIRSLHPELKKVLLEGVRVYQIDPKTTLLTVKEDMGKMIIADKQYADFFQNWVLAIYPQHTNLRMPILINLKTLQWTNDLSSNFAQHSPAKRMLAALQAFYGTEISHIPCTS